MPHAAPSNAPLILFVPGKNPKPVVAAHQAQLFRCLQEGISRANASATKPAAVQSEWLEVLAWNELFYNLSRGIEEEQTWVDQLLSQSGPNAKDKRDAHAWKTRFVWLLYSLGDRFPFLIPLIANPAIRSTIIEIHQYFQNVDDIGRRIRSLLKNRLRLAKQNGQPVLLIGHSMGSVIAYDALWELSREDNAELQVDMLLTMGSPLGLSFVQKRLLGANREGSERYPSNIKRWNNVSAMGELTALDREFADDFHEMIELNLVEEIRDYHKGVYNYFRDNSGLNVHRSYGYLVNPATGRIISDWLSGLKKTES